MKNMKWIVLLTPVLLGGCMATLEPNGVVHTSYLLPDTTYIEYHHAPRPAPVRVVREPRPQPRPAPVRVVKEPRPHPGPAPSPMRFERGPRPHPGPAPSPMRFERGPRPHSGPAPVRIAKNSRPSSGPQFHAPNQPSRHGKIY